MARLTLDIDWGDIDTTQREVVEAQQMVLFEIANKFASQASDFAPVDTGNLAQGIATSLDPAAPGANEYTVSDRTTYGVHVNDGTRPHMPPVNELKDWARRVLGDEGAAWPVAKAIAERGTKPTKFWERAYVEVAEHWVEVFMNKHVRGRNFGKATTGAT